MTLYSQIKKLNFLIAVVAITATGAAFAKGDAASAAAASNQLGFKTVRLLKKRTEKGNIFVSPLSAHQALSMVYNGAKEDTAVEMSSLLQTKHQKDIKQLNEDNAALLVGLTSSKSYTLNIANSLWVRNGFTLRDDFKKDVGTAYKAEVTSLDFGRSDASIQINSWVSKATDKKIAEIVDKRIDPLTVMFLINATYFHAEWAHPFTLTRTANENFRVITEKTGAQIRTVKVPTMHKGAEFRVADRKHERVLELTYKGGEVSMLVIVPEGNVSASAYLNNLDEKAWSDITNDIDKRSTEGYEVSLPKIKLAYDETWNDALKSSGMMPRAFDKDLAQFFGISDIRKDLSITTVKQKTFLDVNEKGTTAAAVTSVEMGTRSLPPSFEKEFKVDRSYVFAIRHVKTNAILFDGAILEPEGGIIENPFVK